MQQLHSNLYTGSVMKQPSHTWTSAGPRIHSCSTEMEKRAWEGTLEISKFLGDICAFCAVSLCTS